MDRNILNTIFLRLGCSHQTLISMQQQNPVFSRILKIAFMLFSIGHSIISCSVKKLTQLQVSSEVVITNNGDTSFYEIDTGYYYLNNKVFIEASYDHAYPKVEEISGDTVIFSLLKDAKHRKKIFNGWFAYESPKDSMALFISPDFKETKTVYYKSKGNRIDLEIDFNNFALGRKDTVFMDKNIYRVNYQRKREDDLSEFNAQFLMDVSKKRNLPFVFKNWPNEHAIQSFSFQDIKYDSVNNRKQIIAYNFLFKEKQITKPTKEEEQLMEICNRHFKKRSDEPMR